MTSKNWFFIPERLPGYNEECEANRKGHMVGAQLRKSTEQRIYLHIRSAMANQHCRPVNGQCLVEFTWLEPNARRDVDNIAFAKKYILDAMQMAKVLPNDSQRYVRGTTDSVQTVKDKQAPGVYVEIVEVEP